MLDEFVSDKGSDYIAGFPSHPHRGFETVTYMLHGKMQHKDNNGNEGIIESGGVQWMTAGRGIIHSEMPLQEDGLMWGFQLWVNLPSHLKMTKPRYQDIPAARVPSYTYPNGIQVRVIAGHLSVENNETISGCVKDIVTSPIFLDVELQKGQEFQYPLQSDMRGFVYTFEGNAEIQGKKIPAHHLGVLSEDSSDTITITTKENCRFLLVAGKPLNEPIAKHGPFVMNTQEQINQAIRDYQMGKF